jgi:hypothetical protein
MNLFNKLFIIIINKVIETFSMNHNQAKHFSKSANNKNNTQQ